MVSTRSMNKETWVKPNTDILRNAPPLSGDEPLISRDEPVIKRKRVRKANDYKSIIRTRSQKIKEALLYHDVKLLAVGTFYKLNKREPRMESSNLAEVELATYIHNLRAAPLNTDFVIRVSEALPWFKWSQEVDTSWSVSDIIISLFTVTLTIGAIYTHLYLSDIENVRGLRAWLSTVSSRAILA